MEGEGAFSSIWSFTTSTATGPAAPTLTYPSDGAKNVSVDVPLAWLSSLGATTYDVLVATDASFALIVFQATNLVSTMATVTGLSAGTTYYWKVRGINSAVIGLFSPARSFTTFPEAPPPPMPIAPGNGSLGTGVSPTFRWSFSTGAYFFALQVSTSPDFDSLVLEATHIATPEYSLSNLLPNTVYFWKVNAENGGGTSPYSEVRNFNTGVITGPPASPAGSPADFSPLQNYPNPFNGETWIELTLPEISKVIVRIFDLLGHLVCSIVQADLREGTYRVRWDGTNDRGARVASGLYLCSMIALGKSGRTFSSSRKIVLLR